ncbi:MAG: NAD(P)/FAD-dependent oxidoreductase, partial [Nitrospiraceae bacterium]
MKRYVIIGGGPAGINAASAIRAGDPEGEILVFDRDQDPPYYRTELDTYIGGSTSDADLLLHPQSYYEEQRINIRLRTVVTRLLPAERSIELAGGERVSYDSLLLAPGSLPLTVAWPGSQVSGVMTIRTWDDARRVIRHVTESNRTVLVVGGGVLGLILAEGIRQRGRPVVLLEREPRLWAPVLDEFASDLIRTRLGQAGIQPFLKEEVAEVFGEDGRVTGVRTTAGQRIETALVVVAIGVRPDIEFLRGSGIRTDRGIFIDHEFRT